ncbi:hypothetical protein BDV98DRAFT_594962 [Pterulicium gracile]|uniref:F-box domain-containing protein n=1 Tax=Pterulicium gracile TaxID=1884261 RepID=A0A5C3QLM3_9AGAR|nr:hypothetical protein BDV98DRAFT_594962 [Pterula gracilis]
MQADDPQDDSQRPFFGCGMDDAERICRPLASPVTAWQSTVAYSKESRGIARSVIQDGTEKFVAINHSIRRLLGHRDHIRRVRTNHQMCLSDVARLPASVLLLIFQETAISARECIWTLAAVCRRWRTLALSSPSLWARIAFTLEPENLDASGPNREVHLKKTLMSCQRALMMIQRAGTNPLEIFLSFTGAGPLTGLTPYEYYCPMIPILVRQLFSHLHRAACIGLRGFAPEYQDIFPDPCPTFASLQYLDIDGLAEGSFELIPPIFASAPALRHFSASHVLFGSSPLLSWNTLVVLQLNFCEATARDIISLLRVTARLEVLKIHMLNEGSTINDPEPDNGNGLYIPSSIRQNAHLPRLHQLDVAFSLDKKQPLSYSIYDVPTFVKFGYKRRRYPERGISWP